MRAEQSKLEQSGANENYGTYSSIYKYQSKLERSGANENCGKLAGMKGQQMPPCPLYCSLCVFVRAMMLVCSVCLTPQPPRVRPFALFVLLLLQVEPAPFDPNSLEMVRLVAEGAGMCMLC
jgi:hypothetical protein